MNRHAFIIILIVIFTSGVFFFYKAYQPTITYEKAPRSDAHKYQKITQYFNEDTEELSVKFPFHSRILVPLLVSFIPGEDLVESYLWLNYVFAVFSVVLLYIFWNRMGFKWPIILLGLSWLVFHWPGIIRLNINDPVCVDVPIYLFHTLLIMLLYTKRYMYIALLSPLATAQKESFIGLLLGLLLLELYNVFIRRGDGRLIKWLIVSLIMAICIKVLINHFYPPAVGSREVNAVITVLFFAKETILHPIRLLQWVSAISIDYGLFLLPAIVLYIRRGFRYDFEELRVLILVIISFSYGLLAGGDMTRIMFLGFPFIMTFILTQLKGVRPLKLYYLTFGSIFFTRVWEMIPDAGVAWSDYTTWFPAYTHTISLIMIPIIYSTVMLVIYFLWVEKKVSCLLR